LEDFGASVFPKSFGDQEKLENFWENIIFTEDLWGSLIFVTRTFQLLTLTADLCCDRVSCVFNRSNMNHRMITVTNLTLFYFAKQTSTSVV